MKNNVKAMQGITAEATVAMSQDIEAPVQDVEVRATVDHKNNPNKDSEWQGYMVLFNDNSTGSPKVVPISAGRLLAIQNDTGTEVFAESEDGLELTNFRFGIKDGAPVFEA